MRLCFNILSFWQVGTGAGEMGTFDSRAARDPDDLPMIPGRQVKGLCRQAVRDFDSLFRPQTPRVSDLFGERDTPHDVPKPGTLRFSDARLPEADRRAVAGNARLIRGLYQTRRSTAMTEDGTAMPHSLRFDEVVIPLKLEATITPLDGAPADWTHRLKEALPLLNAIGSGRTRGMGRVIVTLET